jgi:hypothetical protein
MSLSKKDIIKMKRLKRFNELFDEEELRADHEVEYISGRLQKDIIANKWGNYWEKDKDNIDITRLFDNLISDGVYQLKLFYKSDVPDVKVVKGSASEESLSKFANIDEPSGEFDMFEVSNENGKVGFGIKVIDKETFDFLMYNQSGQNLRLSLERNYTYDEVYNYLKTTWAFALSKILKMPELQHYGKKEYLGSLN